MSRWEPVLCYSNHFPRYIYRDTLPIQHLKFMMRYPRAVHEQRSETVQYSASSAFPCVWRMGGGTHGNSCLGRRFLWASRSGHIHTARQEARWDRPPIYWRWMWVCLAGYMCVCPCLLTDSPDDGYEGAVTQNKQRWKVLQGQLVVKWVNEFVIKGLNLQQQVWEAFVVGTQEPLSVNTEAKGQWNGLPLLKRSRPRFLQCLGE